MVGFQQTGLNSFITTVTNQTLGVPVHFFFQKVTEVNQFCDRVVCTVIIVILNCVHHFFSHGVSLSIPNPPLPHIYCFLLYKITAFVLFLPQDCKLSEGRVQSVSFLTFLWNLMQASSKFSMNETSLALAISFHNLKADFCKINTIQQKKNN